MRSRYLADTFAQSSFRGLELVLGLLENLQHAVADNLVAGKHPSKNATGTLSNALIDAAHSDPDDVVTRSFVEVLTRAETGRWSVGQDVLTEAARVPFSLEAMCEHFAETIRLPHGALWMEFDPCLPIGSDFAGEFSRIGVLLTRASGCSLDICFAGRRAGTRYLSHFAARVGHDGANVELHALPCFDSHEALHVLAMKEEIMPFVVKQVTEVLRVLIVCTARRTPVVCAPLNDFTKVNKARAKHRRPPHVPNQAVRWGLDQQATAANKSNTKRDAGGGGRHLRRHMQRGHFKMRNTGVFWWSHHFRGRAGGEPGPGRDHQVCGRAAVR